MATDIEELRALSFVRRSILKKNEKIRELTRKVRLLENEVSRLKWKCGDKEKELNSNLEAYNEEDAAEADEHFLPENQELDIDKETSQKVGSEQSTKDISCNGIKQEFESSNEDNEWTDAMQAEDLPESAIIDAEQSAVERVSSDQILEECQLGDPSQQCEQSVHQYFDDELEHSQNNASGKLSRVSTVMAAGSGGIYQDGDRLLRTCPTCYKMFRRRDHYQNHLIIHTGERPHVCLLCDSSFNRESSLRRHVKKRHSNNLQCEEHRAAHRTAQDPDVDTAILEHA